MKKLIALIAVLAFLVGTLAGCGGSGSGSGSEGGDGEAAAAKIGVILVGDENEGYTYAHMEGIQKAMESLGIADDQVIWKYSIGEDETCADTARDLADQGCGLIISNSYGHQSYMQTVASEYDKVTFVSMTGDTAAVCGLDNFKNAFTKVFQSRYVSGVVAGMKVKELADKGEIPDSGYDKDKNVKIGYVGAYPYAEVVSGYTAFYLGIKSVYPDVAMEVTYTNSWFDITAEGEAANALMSDGCVIIGQHADSTGAPSAVQAAHEKGNVAYSVGYNVDMLSVAPDVALTSATNNWSVYYTYLFNQYIKGEEIAVDWAEGYESDAVAITELGSACAEGTAEKVDETIQGIKEGTVQPFDASAFTVDGKAVDSHTFNSSIIDFKTGDVVFEGKDYEAIEDGAFQESKFRSAPYFDLRIDGITELN